MKLPSRLNSGAVEALASEDGSALLELVFTLPVLFGLLFCFFELCMALYSYDMISESAREGTRYAMVRGASCKTSSGASCETTVAQIKTYVAGLGWPNVGGGTMTVSPSYPKGSDAVGNPVQVTITYQFRITMPFVPSSAIALSSTSVMYIIQ
jgi:Flp pilus assembly protein TadG